MSDLDSYDRLRLVVTVDNKSDYNIKPKQWTDGKKSINELLSRVPKKINNYYKSFVGWGALFYEIFSRVDHSYFIILSDNGGYKQEAEKWLKINRSGKTIEIIDNDLMFFLA